jgi:cell division protein FtsN
MASGGKRGAGERVLESKHVIGLFLLMMVFSGVFFSLGYVMGRKQYDGMVSASNGPFVRPDVAPKKTPNANPEPEVSDPATSSTNEPPWIYDKSSKPAKVEPHLEPSPKSPASPPVSHRVNAKSSVPPAVAPRTTSSKTVVTTAPLVPAGAVILQVAALEKQDDALALATSLQKKHFSAYVQTPRKDKFYRVQVGPFKDQKSADAAKKGLESAGFKAFFVKH